MNRCSYTNCPGRVARAVPDAADRNALWHERCWTLMAMEIVERPDYQGTDAQYWRDRDVIERLAERQVHVN